MHQFQEVGMCQERTGQVEDESIQIAGVYNSVFKLGGGHLAVVHMAVHSETGEEVAAKLEGPVEDNQRLEWEAKVLKHLQGAPGIPHLHYFGVDRNRNVMVTELLGPSLQEVFESHQWKFSLKTVLMLADQMLYRIEYLHKKSFIHRDIKPENFLLGREKKSNVINIIDFGSAKKFYSASAQQHIPLCDGKRLTGTARYASLNALAGFEQSRRDDLESIGYVVVYFMRGGRLPWQGLRASTKAESCALIKKCKMETSLETLCEGCHPVSLQLLRYCRELGFEDCPDYDYLRQLFHDVFVEEQYVNDGRLDWSPPVPVVSSRTGTSTSSTSATPKGILKKAKPVTCQSDSPESGYSPIAACGVVRTPSQLATSASHLSSRLDYVSEDRAGGMVRTPSQLATSASHLSSRLDYVSEDSRGVGLPASTRSRYISEDSCRAGLPESRTSRGSLGSTNCSNRDRSCGSNRRNRKSQPGQGMKKRGSLMSRLVCGAKSSVQD
jgi:casein kinase 1